MASTRLWGSAVEDNCSEFHTELCPADQKGSRKHACIAVLHQPSGIVWGFYSQNGLGMSVYTIIAQQQGSGSVVTCMLTRFWGLGTIHVFTCTAVMSMVCSQALSLPLWERGGERESESKRERERDMIAGTKLPDSPLHNRQLLQSCLPTVVITLLPTGWTRKKTYFLQNFPAVLQHFNIAYISVCQWLRLTCMHARWCLAQQLTTCVGETRRGAEKNNNTS